MRGIFSMGWLACALCGLAAPAAAAEVEWRGPDPCPDAAELRFSIERIIGIPLSHALPLQFEVRAERSSDGYVARMIVARAGHAAPRRRVLVASDCSRLADLVAVTAAIALGADDNGGSDKTGVGDVEAEPDLARKEPARTQVESLSPHSEARLPSGVDRAAGDELASPRESAWSPALSAWFVADAGSLGRPGTGLAFGGGLEHAPLRVRALGTWLFEQQATFEADGAPGAGAELALAAAAVSACVAPLAPASRWGVEACAGWELGRLSGEGTGVERPRSGAQLWSAPRFDTTLGWRIGPQGLELGAMLTLAVPLVRDDFVLGDLGSVHRPASVVGRAALGINWTLE